MTMLDPTTLAALRAAKENHDNVTTIAASDITRMILERLLLVNAAALLDAAEENKRLRKALEDIATGNYSPVRFCAADIAHTALERTP